MPMVNSTAPTRQFLHTGYALWRLSPVDSRWWRHFHHDDLEFLIALPSVTLTATTIRVPFAVLAVEIDKRRAA